MENGFIAKTKEFINKAKNFIIKYAGFFSVFSIVLFCYLFLFLNLGNYRILDFEEAKFVNAAREMFFNHNYITPHLNFETFFEKPPLFYWLSIISYSLLNSTGEFASRFTNAILGTILIFAVYIFSKKAVNSRVFGLVSSLILLSSLIVCTIFRLAIIDAGFLTLVTLAVLSAGITLFDIKEENKKYFWYLSYLFMGLSALQNGCIGLILPILTILITFLSLGRIKDIIKPVNIIPGLVIYLLIALPWHILAFKANGSVFISDYILKNNLSRLEISSPFFYYIPVIILGFLPWTFSFISAVIRGIKSLIKDFKATKSFKQIISQDTNDKKILIFLSVWTIVVFLFYSLSSIKTISAILPLIPPISMITGYYWWGYVLDNKFEKGIKHSTLIGAVSLIIIGIIGFLTAQIPSLNQNLYIQNSDSFRILLASWLIVMSLIGILCLIAKNRPLLFVSNVILMVGVSIILSGKILSYTASFGQTELENFADKALTVSSSKLAIIGFDKKYSILNKYDKKVEYIVQIDNQGYNKLKNIIDNAKKENIKVYLITKKDAKYPSDLTKYLEKIGEGVYYTLYFNK